MSTKIEGVCAACQAAYDKYEGRMLCEDDKIHRECFDRIRPHMKSRWWLLESYEERKKRFEQPNETIMNLPYDEFVRLLGVGDK